MMLSTLAHPSAELGLDLFREHDWRKLPRWDPRLWHEESNELQCSSLPRSNDRFRALGITWARRHLQAQQCAKPQQPGTTRPSHGRPEAAREKAPHVEAAEDGRKGGAGRAQARRAEHGTGWAARTGKEEDVEVGLTYFGKRFLSPYLGRWVSADPLAVHAPGAADSNLYAYVSGATLKNVDPLGLCSNGNTGGCGGQETGHPAEGGVEGAPASEEQLRSEAFERGAEVGRHNLDVDRAAKEHRVEAMLRHIGSQVEAKQSLDRTPLQQELDAIERWRVESRIPVPTSGNAREGYDYAYNIEPTVDAVGELAMAVATRGKGGGGKVRVSAPPPRAQGKPAPVAKETGSYMNTHDSGRTYSGKGSRERSQESGRRIEKLTGDKHTATEWKAAKDAKEAFKDEARRIEQQGGPKNDRNYNKIESPGKRLLEEEQ